MTWIEHFQEYEEEWRELKSRLIAAVLHLRRGRSPEEDAALALGEEWVRLSFEREESVISFLFLLEAHRIEEAIREEAEARAFEEA